MEARILFFALLVFSSQLSHAQFGKLIIKAGADIALKEGGKLLSKRLHETKAKFDSTSFSYAISLSDKAAQFESKDKLADVVTVSTLLLDKDKDKTDLEAAQEYMDVGEMAYSSNGFKLAEGSFILANAIMVTEDLTDNPLYGRGLANLGLLYNSMGRYSASEEFTIRGLEVRGEQQGKDSKDYAASLNNLAVLDKDLGNYNKAEKEITEAIQLNKAAVGEDGIAYAISLNNRGVLYQTLGRYKDAEKDMLLALEVASKTLKTGSLQYTRLQSNLALLYQQQGLYDEAEAIFKNAISSISRTKNKKTNPDYAHMIENLASLYKVMGEFESAESLYKEALAVYEKKFGTEYSGYGLTSARLGDLYLTQKNFPDAEKNLLTAEYVLTKTFGMQHPYTVDLQVQLGVLYWQQEDAEKADDHFTTALNKSLEFVGEYFAPMSENEKALYWKTLQPRFEKYYAFASTQENEDIFSKTLHYRLATKAMLLSGSTKVKAQILQSGDTTLINDYQAWLDQKGALAHYYAMSQEELREQEVNLDSINRAANTLEKSLSERSGLFDAAYHSDVATVEDVKSSLKATEKAVEIIRITENAETSLAYLAFIISKDKIDKVVLTNGEELEGKYFKLYRNLIKYKKEDTYSYAQFWQPINEKLGNPTRTYISLDGVYNQININSLFIGDGKYALDEHEYITVSSLRDLTTDNGTDETNSKTAILFGNPTYGSSNIAPLPGTGVEVTSINTILKKSGYTTKMEVGTNASESNFKNIEDRSLVHMATHGFFIADPKQGQNAVFSVPLYNVNENVLLRSGLILAGGGDNSDLINDLTVTDNGVLTSYEVMNLDLDNTDLVVLSACETGLGDVMSGEGVFGLQRAFMVAGASSVIMSLWKVDDTATQELMVNFYSNWLASNNMEEAFRKAQKQVRSSYNHPYYWGSFVLLKN